MALGRRGGERQEALWVPTATVARGPGHPLYDQLNELLTEAGFDRWVEARTADMRHPRRTPMRLTLSLPQFAAA